MNPVFFKVLTKHHYLGNFTFTLKHSGNTKKIAVDVDRSQEMGKKQQAARSSPESFLRSRALRVIDAAQILVRVYG